MVSVTDLVRFGGRSRIAVNVRFTEFAAAIEIVANAVSGSYDLITFPKVGVTHINMNSDICTINICDTSEADILIGTAYNWALPKKQTRKKV